jgi:uncharacterized protein (TIGR03437 family)
MGIPFGQRSGLSAGDLDAVKRLYGFPNTDTTISTFPEGLRIIVDGETYVSPRTFAWAPGTTHTLDVSSTQPDIGSRYQFARWSDEREKTHAITASPATTVYTANFIQEIRIAGAASPALGGSLQYNPPSSDGYYPYGTELEILAVPNSGYNFMAWGGFGFFSTHGFSPNPVHFTLNDPRIRYDATFSRSILTTVTSDPPGLTVSVDGTSVITPRSFAWTTGSNHLVRIANEAQFNFASTERYLYQNWSDGGDALHTVIAGAEPTVLTAGFKRQYLVSTSMSPITGGTLVADPVSPDGFYDGGTEIKFLPVATGAFQFMNWSGDLSGAAAPATVKVDDQKVVTANFAAPRQLTTSSLVSAANFLLNGGVAPGEIITIFGLNFGPDSLVTSRINPGTQRLDTVLSDTRVLFDGIPAPLVYVSPNQISAIVPYSVAGNIATRVAVTYNNQSTNSLTVPVVDAVPALFTFDSSGKGPAALLNQDGSANTQANPAQRGSTVVLYGTGEGQTVPGGTDGKPAVVPLPKPALPVKVLLAGREAIVTYAGAAPGLTAGVIQVNVFIPLDSPTGAVPVSLVVGTKASPANTTIWVQ